jgi:hypothetical protein
MEEERKIEYQRMLLEQSKKSVVVPVEGDVTRTVSSNLLSSTGSISWLEEYTHGMKHEIYRIKLNKSFIGLTFASACIKVYDDFGITMFAVLEKRTAKNTSSNFLRTYLFPGTKVRNILLRKNTRVLFIYNF